MKDCNLKFSNFQLVRRTTCPANWFSATDILKGTAAAYGILGTECNYGIKFDKLSYDEMLITSEDYDRWLVVPRSVVDSLPYTFSSDPINVLSSSLSIDTASTAFSKLWPGNTGHP
jgi:hypothetical protein